MFSFIQPGALVVALLSLVVLVLWERPVIKRVKATLWIQGPLVAVALGIVLNEVFKSWSRRRWRSRPRTWCRFRSRVA